MEKKQYPTISEFHSQKINEAISNPELDAKSYPYLSFALEQLFAQASQLIVGLEREVVIHDTTEYSDDSDYAEQQIENIIRQVTKQLYSLSRLIGPNYEPHPKLKHVARRTNNANVNLQTAIKVNFNPVSLSQYQDFTPEMLGANEIQLREYLTRYKSETKSADTVSQRINELITGCFNGWTKEIMRNSSKYPVGITFEFGETTVDPATHQPKLIRNQTSFSLEIRYNTKLGLHFVPSFRYEDEQTRRKQNPLSYTGEPIAINIPSQTGNDDTLNQDSLNNGISGDLEKLGLLIR